MSTTITTTTHDVDESPMRVTDDGHAPHNHWQVIERTGDPQTLFELGAHWFAKARGPVETQTTTGSATGGSSAQGGGAVVPARNDSAKQTHAYEMAVEWWLKAARAGHAIAQHNLAGCMAAGKGTVTDFDAAVDWMELAAKQGRLASMHALGELLMKRSASGDVDRAHAWWKRAADEGHAPSQYNYGAALFNGDVPSVPHDVTQALAYLGQAAQQGHASAEAALRDMTFHVSATDAVRSAHS